VNNSPKHARETQTSSLVAPPTRQEIVLRHNDLSKGAVQGAGQQYYLRALHIDNFGAFHQKDIGPFGPGLNVVYGRNEAGKTTIRQFIGGVLFGWPQGGSRTNSYSNTSGDRAGTLNFSPRADAGGAGASRAGTATGDADTGTDTGSAGVDGVGSQPNSVNAASAQRDAYSAEANGARTSYGSEIRITRTSKRGQPEEDSAEHSGLLADIDKTTYANVFSLDTDELMDLKAGDKLTSRFLSASADTAVSPSQAKQNIENQIKDCFSRSQAESYKRSIPNLKAQLSQVQSKLEEAEEQRHRLFDDRETYKNLSREERTLNERIARLQSLEKQLSNCETNLVHWKNEHKKFTEDVRDLDEQKDDLTREERTFESSHDAYPDKKDSDIMHMRKDIQALRKKLTRSEDALQDAKTHREDSYVRLQTLKNKMAKEQTDSVSTRTTRAARRALPSVLTLILLAIGVLTFSFGRIQSSISITGLGMVILALAFVGMLAIVVAGRRQIKQPSHLLVLENQLESDQTTFDRDDALFNIKQKDYSACEKEIATWIQNAGFGEYARNLDEVEDILDSLEEIHKTQRLFHQRWLSLNAQDVQLRKRERNLAEEHQDILRTFEDADINDSASDLEQKLENALSRVAEELKLARDEQTQNLRHLGQLNERFSRAANDNELSELRLQVEKLHTKLDDAHKHLAVLLLARDLISGALHRWESQSSPDVYGRAGHILEAMTSGAWDHVQLDSAGKIQAVSFSGNTMKPVKMSLGTRQQLYLSLRLALLQTASDVGKNVPVLCDDILVNFDEARREGAAKAIASLAAQRQIIVFTCHQDVVSLLKDVCPNITEISL